MKPALALIVFTLILSACSAREPQGPAERIGRGIDEIAKGLREAGDQMGQQEKEEQARRKELERRYDDRRYDDTYYDDRRDSDYERRRY